MSQIPVTNNRQYNIAILLLLLAIAIGFIEFLIMQILPWLQIQFPGIPEALLDALLLSLSITPIVYLLIRKHIVKVTSDASNIRNKLIISSGFPLIIAIALMLNIVNNKQEDISILHQTESIIKLDVNIAKLINATNEEFEFSALLLSETPANLDKTLRNKSLRDLKELRIVVDALLDS